MTQVAAIVGVVVGLLLVLRTAEAILDWWQS